jgi:hypothetical protein
MLKITRTMGRYLASYLSKPRPDYTQHDTTSIERILQVIEPGDILLVDGNSRISTAIKYLTQSTWSHACLYVGAIDRSADMPSLVEADLNEGVTLVPLNKYEKYNVRICRPVGLTESEKRRLLSFVEDRLGYRYDLKNIIDLMRYLIQNPAVPARYRRQLLSLGSGGAHPGDLLDADRPGLSVNRLPDPAEAEPGGGLRGAALRAPPSHPLRAPRFRSVALFPRGQANAGTGLRLPPHELASQDQR